MSNSPTQLKSLHKGTGLPRHGARTQAQKQVSQDLHFDCESQAHHHAACAFAGGDQALHFVVLQADAA